MANRLVNATSPYLLQHAENPVDWWEWGPDAFAEAKRRDTPILLSVGYAACHWCHVMAHESFTDPAAAELVNRDFVAIKVDREERPDVDAVYMLATQALTGQGGWPMTVFLTPEGLPFFAGTYYPPQRHGQMPSFTEVVAAIADTWATRRDEVRASADQIAAAIADLPPASDATAPVGLRETVAAVLADFDPVHGGFGGAPKFPVPTLLEALLVKGEPASVDVAQRTLEAMARGGIHDQLGGGFARYSVDAGWVAPHFEKMLYDNGLLLGVYTRAWCRTADHDGLLRDYFAGVVRGIVTWLATEMRTDEGGFAASLDADSADVRGRVHEGIYYLWSPELLEDALGAADADWAAGVFHVTSTGSFEHGLSTLQLRGNPDPARLARVKERMLAVRAERFRPMRVESVIAAWNGWTIDALVRAALVFGEPAWLDLARAAAAAVWETHWIDGRLRRMSRGGTAAAAAGVLEDHAALAGAYVTLAGALGDATWLDRAGALLQVVVDRFGAGAGFFDTADDAEPLFRRPRDLTDNAVPCGTSAAVSALHAYALATGETRWADRATAAAGTLREVLATTPRAAGAALTDALVSDEARARLLRGAVGVAASDPFAELARAAHRMAPAGSFILTAPPGTPGFGGLLAGVDAPVGGEPVAVVRRGDRLLGPADGLERLRDALWTRV
ncbi:thioredoxin domain-containing protein [Propionicicella superfundia]|uniref:thioredoxin domain-containing protein n=1 Tax=Propionicicella superfundia TaxID=348582 RepID=UPI00040959DE|nr:thioredoxin domain-containing protein [Propionicicella superfundia]